MIKGPLLAHAAIGSPSAGSESSRRMHDSSSMAAFASDSVRARFRELVGIAVAITLRFWLTMCSRALPEPSEAVYVLPETSHTRAGCFRPMGLHP